MAVTPVEIVNEDATSLLYRVQASEIVAIV
jgi:hypothetical protein